MATAAHGAAVYGLAQLMLPALEVAPPAVFWPKEEITTAGLNHPVYVITTRVAYRQVSLYGGYYA